MVTDTRTGCEFAQFLDKIERSYTQAEKIVLVLDNLSTHKEKHLIECFGEEKGKQLWSWFEVHYTPKHGSWLNQTEIAIGIYSRQCLGDGRMGDKTNLIRQTHTWNKRANRNKQSFY